VRVNVVSLLVVTVNSLCCVVVGIVVWYEYSPTPLHAADSNKYAIVGALQLWMILVAVAAALCTEASETIRTRQLARVTKYLTVILRQCLQCFDAVGWASGRASGLSKT